MNENRTLVAFLGLVDQQVLRLGPRDHLAIERFVRARGEPAHGELRASLASILARDQEQWERIASLYDACFFEGDSNAKALSAARQTVVLRKPKRQTLLERLQSWLMAARSRLVDALRRAPRSWWILGIVGVIAILVAVPVYFMLRPQRVVEEPLPLPSPPPSIVEVIQESSPEAEFRLVPVAEGSKNIVTLKPPEAAPSTLAALALISTLLMLLGFRFVRLAPAVAADRRARLAARRSTTDGERHRLEEQKATAGKPLQIRYRVERFLPVSRQAVLASAELLGRLFREEHGVELDAEATLDRTVAAAGRFSPVVERRFSRQEVLVLVDVEEGSHPWLEGFRRLLLAWSAQGIILRCFEFQMTPHWLVDMETRQPVRINELARRTEDLPLVVFSRSIDPSARRGEASWLNELGAWPRRAWLDPDPRRPDERSPSRRLALRRFGELGLPRFHLSDEGVLLLARWLAGDEQAATSSREPSMRSVDEVAEALRKWALAAALVPDPTWDQLEAIRRHFSELHQDLDEPRYLQRLLEWVGCETGLSAESEGGRGLNIPEQYQDKWLREQRRLEREDPTQAGFEARARRLLLVQLGMSAPDDELDAQWWRFKCSMHWAVLEPERAVELLAWIYDSPVAHEAGRWVEQEVKRQTEGVANGLSIADVEVLQDLAGGVRKVPIRSLLLGHRALWGEMGLNSIGIGLVLVLLLLSFAWQAPSFFAVEEDRSTPGTPVFHLVPQPQMIEIQGGEFQMGSDSGIRYERPVHIVEVASFQISKTEVTVAQYRACVDAAACKKPPDTGENCNWSKGDREDHPINCVSWYDAQDYAEWIGARLPTEAEWEYAARSQGLAREYPWGDEPADCDRAVVFDKGALRCGKDSTWPVCSKAAGNTEQGLCDMVGNVREWVEDDWHDSYEGAPSKSWESWQDKPRSLYRVNRGGSFDDIPLHSRVAYRVNFEPSRRFADLGFRVARSLPSAL